MGYRKWFSAVILTNFYNIIKDHKKYFLNEFLRFFINNLKSNFHILERCGKWNVSEFSPRGPKFRFPLVSECFFVDFTLHKKKILGVKRVETGTILYLLLINNFYFKIYLRVYFFLFYKFSSCHFYNKNSITSSTLLLTFSLFRLTTNKMRLWRIFFLFSSY